MSYEAVVQFLNQPGKVTTNLRTLPANIEKGIPKSNYLLICLYLLALHDDYYKYFDELQNELFRTQIERAEEKPLFKYIFLLGELFKVPFILWL